MDFLLDTAKLDEIERCYKILALKGVTTNPTIVSKETGTGEDPEINLRNIHDFVSKEGGEFHIQMLSEKCEDIIAEAHRAISLYGEDTHIKIPITIEGLKAIKLLTKENIAITATAIYSYAQAILAFKNGATDLALYCNRMENMGIDYKKVIMDIKKSEPSARVLGASFKTFNQVRDAIIAGADAVTVQPSTLLSQLDMGFVIDAVNKFTEDWNSVFKA